MDELTFGSIGLIIGGIIGFIIRDYLLHIQIRDSQESNRLAHEMEQRIWKEVREELDKEKNSIRQEKDGE